MCGISINKNKLNNRLSHRGITCNEAKVNGWEVIFNSLPLSSNFCNLEQPLRLKNYTLCFNGEIFNYKDLDKYAKSDLDYLQRFLQKGHDYAKLFSESHKWDGFWAICLIDKNSDVFFFTDPLGKKQLYFSKDGIASEIKQLYKGDSLMDYNEKTFGKNGTPFQNIYRAIPGEIYKYRRNNDVAYRIGNFNIQKAIKDFKISKNSNIYSIINKAVKDRLENRIDGVSLLLSSGLDSNIIFHHVINNYREVEIVTMLNSETDDVIKILEPYNIAPVIIKDEYTEKDYEDALYYYEHPLDYGSLMPNYLMFKECSNHLILTGDGSDEFFRGYKRSEKYSTFKYDALMELPYYHNIRIDRTSMAHTKEARNPLMSNELFYYCYYNQNRIKANKQDLRDLYSDVLPSVCIKGKKKPLRSKDDKQFNIDLINNKFKQVWTNQKKR